MMVSWEETIDTEINCMLLPKYWLFVWFQVDNDCLVDFCPYFVTVFTWQVQNNVLDIAGT